MPIIEGILADIDGVRPGQVRIENGIIVAVGSGLGKPDHVFDDECLIFAGMGDIHIHAREDVTGKETHKETFATAAAAALHGGVDPRRRHAQQPGRSRRRRQLCRQGKPGSAAATCRWCSRSMPASGRAPNRCGERFPTRRTWGPASASCFFPRWKNSTAPWPRYQGQAVSFHCEDPILLQKHQHAATHEERRPAECELSATRFALAMIEKYRLTGKLCHYSVGEGSAADSGRQGQRAIRHGRGHAAPRLLRHEPDSRRQPSLDANEPAAACARPIARPCSRLCATARRITWPPITPRTPWPRRNAACPASRTSTPMARS